MSSTFSPHVVLTGAAMLCLGIIFVFILQFIISWPVHVISKAGSRGRVRVAGSHRPAKPAFCRYRQKKLVLYKCGKPVTMYI